MNSTKISQQEPISFIIQAFEEFNSEGMFESNTRDDLLKRYLLEHPSALEVTQEMSSKLGIIIGALIIASGICVLEKIMKDGFPIKTLDLLGISE